MEQIELFSIDKFKCNSEAKYYLNIIEGEWHPQDLNDSPLKFILSTSDDSDYICKYINTEHKQLTLYNKNNSSIVIEILYQMIINTTNNYEHRSFGNFS